MLSGWTAEIEKSQISSILFLVYRVYIKGQRKPSCAHPKYEKWLQKLINWRTEKENRHKKNWAVQQILYFACPLCFLFLRVFFYKLFHLSCWLKYSGSTFTSTLWVMEIMYNFWIYVLKLSMEEKVWNCSVSTCYITESLTSL